MFKKILEEKGTASVGQKEVKIIDLQRATKYVVIVQAFNKLVSETVRNSNFTLTFSMNIQSWTWTTVRGGDWRNISERSSKGANVDIR